MLGCFGWESSSSQRSRGRGRGSAHLSSDETRYSCYDCRCRYGFIHLTWKIKTCHTWSRTRVSHSATCLFPFLHFLDLNVKWNICRCQLHSQLILCQDPAHPCPSSHTNPKEIKSFYRHTLSWKGNRILSTGRLWCLDILCVGVHNTTQVLTARPRDH